jgi:NAD-dependent dihydropyrimidine dehydrogenase PreA subunit
VQAHYGYKDGSGDYFIIIDTDKCNGCGICEHECPVSGLKAVRVLPKVKAEVSIEN